jgi:hypothetical protein
MDGWMDGIHELEKGGSHPDGVGQIAKNRM